MTMTNITEQTQVSAVQRLWQTTPPDRVSSERWDLIQKIALSYEPSKVTDAQIWKTWRNFALSALCASQPRREASVRNRLANFARHVHINRFNYDTATVGWVFSDRARRSTEIYCRRVEVMSPGNLAHVRRDLSALHQGLLLPPRKFIHSASNATPMSNDISVVRYVARTAKEPVRSRALQVIDWFNSEDYLLEPPFDAFSSVRIWCLRNYSHSIALSNVRAERALVASSKSIPIVDVLKAEHLFAELMKPTSSDTNVMKNALRFRREVWSIPDIDTELIGMKDTQMKTKLPPSKNNETQTRRGTRASMRRLKKEMQDGLSVPAQKLPDVYEHILDSMKLRCMEKETWQSVKPIVSEIMRRSHIRGTQSFTKHVRILAQYVHWAQLAKRDLALESLLTTSEIEAWAGTGLISLLPDTRATYRSLIRSVASHINPNKDAPPAINRLPKRSIRPPYSEREVTRIKQLATTQADVRTRATLMVCAALGFGAGVDATDLLSMTTQSIKDHGEEGIEVVILGPRARTSWMLPEYQEFLRDGLAILPQQGALFTAAELKNKGTVGRLYEKPRQIGNTPIAIDQSRMRNTWLCVLMNMPIPANVVMVAAGLETGRTLGDLLQFANKATPTTLKEYMAI